MRFLDTLLCRTTIANSKYALLSISCLVSVACSSGARPAESASQAGKEAPAPHLLAPVEGAQTHEHADHHGEHEAREQTGRAATEASVSESGAVTLDEILSYADEHSPELRVARTTRSRARAAQLAADIRATSNPELTFAVGPRMSPSGGGIDVDATLLQSIRVGGERGLQKKSADRFKELTEAEIEQVRWEVHCQVHAAFHAALVEAEREKVAERVVEFQREVLRVVEAQIKAGETAPLTLRLAEAEVAQAEQVLTARTQSVNASRIVLAQLSGWPVSAPPRPTGLTEEPRDPPEIEQLVRAAETSLPSLKVASARVAEAESRQSAADRGAFPEPRLGVDYSREANAESQGGINHVVKGVLVMPIPSFQMNQGERARSQADREVALAERDARLSLLEGQIALARSETVAAAKRSRAYRSEILPRFEENLSLLRRSFELGEIDILALASGRERFLQIQSDALSAELAYFTTLADLERVVGVDLWHDHH